ncbi:flagellar hook protein FlgL [Bacillus manliponensis]|uniref:Flagellar hook protein FlgL n=1 Tax=Bacillus manliponensis TaxID=574376 RepID=A0A073KE92_9BACI|nr:flagellar hook-associated protein 3 [Bacillus manliponensis]KEK20628.1 flagellar hook protein FlgL [Bacillus manliponensis]
MRVSTYQNVSWAKRELMNLNMQQQHYRNQVTSGKKHLKMSDDPLSASKSFAIEHSISNIGQMKKDVTDSQNILKHTESSLQGIAKALDRTNQLTVQALNGTNGPDELKAISTEIDELLKQVVYLANTKEEGRYLFGGEGTTQPPFAEDGTYQGGVEDVYWTLNDGYKVKAFQNGESLLTPTIQTLTKLKDALHTGDRAAAEALMDANKQNFDNVLNKVTEVGSITNTLSTFTTILNEQNLALHETKKEIEDVELSSAITDLAYANATYEATLKAVSTMNKISMLDYM